MIVPGRVWLVSQPSIVKCAQTKILRYNVCPIVSIVLEHNTFLKDTRSDFCRWTRKVKLSNINVLRYQNIDKLSFKVLHKQISQNNDKWYYNNLKINILENPDIN